MVIKHYSMNAHQTFVVVKSGLKVLFVQCPNSNKGCPWKLRATMSNKYNNKWVIKKWDGRYTCMNAMLSQDHNKLDSEFNLFLHIRKAWKEKQKAISRVFGDWEDSYDLLPRWLDRMLDCCLGSTYRLETTNYVSNNVVETHFRKCRRVFWTLKPTFDSFNYIKPIKQIDGTFLYGKYRDTLLISTTQDDGKLVEKIGLILISLQAPP
uniref:Uncharacterized protein n=1 Tax=Cajanus cajan TaxID=3821 RepID=A0A151QLD4_CAJCA|nr:hypothetical protein KK1_048959 [Cajanus cajan]